MADVATPTLLEELQDKRSKLGEELDTLIDEREEALKEIEAREGEATEEQRSADEASVANFRDASKQIEADLTALDARIEQQERKEERRKNAKPGHVEVTNEPAVYRKDNAEEFSFFRDMLASHSLSRNLAPRGASERMERHQRETEDRQEKRELKQKRESEIGIEQAEAEFRSSLPGHVAARGFAEDNPFEKRANPSRETGHGGEFVPPLWLVEDDFIPALRASRVIAPLCRNLPVPPGTDTIKLPKIKLGTEVAPQVMDAAGVASRDVETEFVEAAVKTLAGQEDVAIQLIEQSPGQVFDRVVQEDLLADYHRQLDREVSIGAGTNYTTLNAGTIRGLFPGTEWGAGKRTSTTTILPNVQMCGLNANWSHIAKERFDVNNVHHVVNPAYPAYWASALDSTGAELGRPQFNASDFPNFNILGELPATTPAEGLAMQTPLGPRVYATANIPPILPMATTEKGEQKKILFAANKEPNELLTSGTECYSYGLTAKFDDVWFFESDLRTRVLPEVLSGTLQIRFQVYAYISLLVRYGPSLQFCGGKAWKVAGGYSEAPVEPKLGGYAF